MQIREKEAKDETIEIVQKEQQYLQKKEITMNRQMHVLKQEIKQLKTDLNQQIKENLNLLVEGFGLDWNTVLEIKREFLETNDHKTYLHNLQELNSKILLQAVWIEYTYSLLSPPTPSRPPGTTRRPSSRSSTTPASRSTCTPKWSQSSPPATTCSPPRPAS